MIGGISNCFEPPMESDKYMVDERARASFIFFPFKKKKKKYYYIPVGIWLCVITTSSSHARL
jgi:hypothetical protein